VSKSPHHESERRTRKARIDPKLAAAGWTIIPFDFQTDLSSYKHHAI
jgi:type I site-specific restriction endonuclease